MRNRVFLTISFVLVALSVIGLVLLLARPSSRATLTSDVLEENLIRPTGVANSATPATQVTITPVRSTLAARSAISLEKLLFYAVAALDTIVLAVFAYWLIKFARQRIAPVALRRKIEGENDE